MTQASRRETGAGMNAPSSLAILVVAGGRGSRAGDGLPKQYRALLG
ncbi:MAG: bifunctional 2-C-methyl-D-erythritol 4-phosphate cytidylyltransferase/2-C-methyl-D-erythritol 2,4-cyclodiphosphate synthase, partial [Methylocystaceae bacterium]